jgi:hypothetical protein
MDGASLARRWAARYTRGLPPTVSEGRRAEIDSDVFEHQAVGGTHAAVMWRTLRGVPADLAWRREERQRMQASHRPTSRLRATWGVVTQNWFAPLAALVAAFDILFAIAVATEEGGTMPGRAVGPVVLLALAALLLGGLWLRWRAGAARLAQPAAAPRRPVSTRWLAALVGLLVVVLAMLVVGSATGVPMVFFSALTVVLATALVLAVIGVRRAVRASDPAARLVLADGMIIVGVLPGLAMFWMVIPPLVALAVIVGVLTTNPRVRPAG